ncbi:MAG TPA: hypothetical protein VER03_26090, partial [Bryobacteraceae bacterium]|nr:hypothetical protein [Bryobacteraceae bacterium]
ERAETKVEERVYDLVIIGGGVNGCGIARDAAGLSEACQRLESTTHQRLPKATRENYEVRNLHAVAMLIARCALARQESRGGHYRTDFPETRAEFQKHSQIDKHSSVSFS